MRVASWAGVLTAGLIAVAGGVRAADDYESGARAFAGQDYQRSLAVWQPLAAAGNPRAQYGLGLLFNQGWGGERDPFKAQHWYTLAAERGHPGAQYNLAVMRDTGAGLPRDSAQAAFWYTEAARQGLPEAAYNLALMTLAGDGLRREPAEAVEWLDRARPMDRARLIAALPSAEVRVARANIRTEPARDAAIVGRADAGETLQVFAQRGDWVEVWQSDARDGVGWMAARLLDGLPSPGRARVRLDRFEYGPLTALSAKRAGRPDDAPATRATTTRERARAERRLLRNSGWLADFDGFATGDARGTPARVATARLNVRAAPSTDAAVVARLRHHETVRVVGRRSGWRRILLPDSAKSGWAAAFLLDEPDALSGHAEARGRAVTVAADTVNVRGAPSSASSVRTRLHRGDVVHVLGERRGWRRVRLQDRSNGWVAAFLLAGETSAPPAAERVSQGASGG